MRADLRIAIRAFLAFNLLFTDDPARNVPARYYSMSSHSSHLDNRLAHVERLSNPETHEPLVRRYLYSMVKASSTETSTSGGPSP